MSDEIDDVIKKVYSESDIPNMDKEILDFLKSMLEPDNIELKTHINKKNLNNFVLLELYANSVKKYSKKTYDLIKAYEDIYFRYALSTDRQSRTEMLSAIKSLKNNELSINEDEQKKRRFLK